MPGRRTPLRATRSGERGRKRERTLGRVGRDEADPEAQIFRQEITWKPAPAQAESRKGWPTPGRVMGRVLDGNKGGALRRVEHSPRPTRTAREVAEAGNVFRVVMVCR